MLRAIRFETQLQLTNDPDDDLNWLLIAELVCVLIAEDGERIITVPRGFKTDLASTPRLLWPLFPPFGRWDEAAVLHDYLYRIGGARSRDEADAALYFGMAACQVPRWRAWTMWAAVRLFGGIWYRTNRDISP